jgi:2-methylcitrate dehydratase PrpD
MGRMTDRIIAEELAKAAAHVTAADLPRATRRMAQDLVLDVAGLCVAARKSGYMTAMIAGLDANGACTAIGHAATFDPVTAILVNGTAAHGDDYDDTFEGGPVHSGAVIVPTMLAVAERHGSSGADILAGLVVGCEVMCRLGLVAPRAVHKAGFHPTSVFGAMGAAAAVATALRLPPDRFASALGLAGSMASGIIEYLAEGTWTKRMHAGWAGQSGYRAARLAEQGFAGPRTVFEGEHGLFFGFARAPHCDWSKLLDGFGTNWVSETIAFKPYPCGTMAHPYIDCALRLRKAGLDLDGIDNIVCETAEGFVHRLWEPLATKQHPPNGYAGKFSIPFAIATALIRGEAGLAAFEDEAARDPSVVRIAKKVHYIIDPDHPYPHRFTGHMRVTLRDGRVIEERQPHLRGGVAEPLLSEEIAAKFAANVRHGGWLESKGVAARQHIARLFDAQRIELGNLRG